ncbi:unnamed protein product [Rotaria socialis]|uniref:Uncharacterized protein n=1 Tax=Rotaria socialis TaxID=392032 RepID=A0A821CBS1_9BILA|nr:unnamed protein product [Rotaria socialis]
MPPLCMIKGSIVAVASNKWTITETWIPTTMQLGSQVYCAVATDNAQIQSDQYCLTFNSPGEAPVTTTTTAGRRRRRRADRESKKKPTNTENISFVTVIKLPREMLMTPGGNIIKVVKSNILSQENTQLSDKSFSTIDSAGSVRTSKVNRSSLPNKAQASPASFITLP